jgi:hydrogenase nickel incorporation protein HypA/HybF
LKPVYFSGTFTISRFLWERHPHFIIEKWRTGMHELPVIESILNICLKHAQQNDVQKVLAIHLEIGELSDLENEWMQSYFDHLSKGSIAEGAVLKIKRTPVVMKCGGCETSFNVDVKSLKDIKCPSCNAEKNFQLVSGREYHILNMEAI